MKRAFAVFQKGGVIMDVTNGEQAKIAEAAGAVAVMALERIPADIKADGGVARSSGARLGPPPPLRPPPCLSHPRCPPPRPSPRPHPALSSRPIHPPHSDPNMIVDVMESCSIPVMAKSRIGHFYESKVLEALEVDCIDESEVLTAADETHHIDKRAFNIPFVCGAQVTIAARPPPPAPDPAPLPDAPF